MVPQIPKITAALDQRAQKVQWSALARITAGLAITVGVPMVLAAWDVVHTRVHHGAGLDWVTGTLILLVVITPIAYIVEWWTKGRFLMDRLREIEAGDGWLLAEATHDRTWRWQARAEVAQWEILLTAPRLVFEGWATWRMGRRMRKFPVERAAQILAIMLASMTGLAIDQLHIQGEDTLIFSQALAYLVFYEWIGVSANSAKAWALTETRDFFGPQRARDWQTAH